MAEDLADTHLTEGLDSDDRETAAQLELLEVRDQLLGAEAELRSARAAHAAEVAELSARCDRLQSELEAACAERDEALRAAAALSLHFGDALAENAELLDDLRRAERDARLAGDRAFVAERRALELEHHAERVQSWSEEIVEHAARVEAWANAVAAHRDELQAHLDHDAPLARAYEDVIRSRAWRLLQRLRRLRPR